MRRPARAMETRDVVVDPPIATARRVPSGARNPEDGQMLRRSCKYQRPRPSELFAAIVWIGGVPIRTPGKIDKPLR